MTRARLLLPLTAVVLLSLTESAMARTLTETVSPSVYTVLPGGQFTLSGFFSTLDAVTYTGPGAEYLTFGTNPMLGITAGSASLFAPGEEQFLGLGYLGPPSFTGPIVTTVSDLRTFVVPADAPLGVYQYTYVALFGISGTSSNTTHGASFTVDVVPEPASLAFVLIGLLVLTTARRLSGTS